MNEDIKIMFVQTENQEYGWSTSLPADIAPLNLSRNHQPRSELSAYMNVYWELVPSAPAKENNIRGGAEKRIDLLRRKTKKAIALT